MLPSVNVYRRNGLSIQALPGKMLMILGPSDSGAVDTPAAKTRGSDVVSTFGGGPLVEDAGYAIKNYRLPCVCVRTEATTVSDFSAITRTTGHGASVVTVDGASATKINALVMVMITNGDTVGVTGITYKVSIDGGANYGVTQTLLTATSITIDLGGSNLILNLTSATLATGEIISLYANLIAAGTFGTLDTSLYPGAACSASASLKSSTYPNDNYQGKIRFVDGGALQTAGITYQESLDDGRSWSELKALGTALEITFEDAGTATITLGTAAQTIADGAELSVRMIAPMFTAETVATAVDAAFRYSGAWEWMLVSGVVTPDLAVVIDAAFRSHYLADKERGWIGGWRLPGCKIPGGTAVDADETDTEYQTAFNTAWSTTALEFGCIAAADCKMVSAISGRVYKRSPAMVVAPREASVAPNIDIAYIPLGALPGVSLYDEAGNTDCHDEATDPGLDDMRAITLRSWESETGVYVTNPRVFTAAGSDIEMMPHLECFNLETRALRSYFRRNLSVDLYANLATGKLRDSDRRTLEAGANKAANAALVTPGYISGQLTTISPDDDLLTVRPATLTVEAEIVPKIYPKQINLTISMVSQLPGV
jgi:hypothetical protein